MKERGSPKGLEGKEASFTSEKNDVITADEKIEGAPEETREKDVVEPPEVVDSVRFRDFSFASHFGKWATWLFFLFCQTLQKRKQKIQTL